MAKRLGHSSAAQGYRSARHQLQASKISCDRFAQAMTTKSISTRTSRGSRETSTVERAGGF